MKLLRTLSLAAALAMPSLASAEMTIIFNNFLPPADTFNRNVVQRWVGQVEEATEGRVKLQQPTASLAPPPELLNTVQQGIADAGFIMVSFLENSNPLLQLTLLPGVNGNAEQTSVALWRTYQEHLAAGDTLADVHLLGLAVVPPGHLYTMRDTPIESIDDMQDLKMWGLPGVSAKALGALGAVVSPGPAVRMYEIISGGVVDAFCCINYPALESFNVTQFMDSATEVPGGVFAPTFAFFIRDDIWSAISPQDREAIMDVSGEAMARLTAGVDEDYEAGRQKYVDNGGTVITASDEFAAQLQEAWKPLVEKWVSDADAAGIDGQAAFDYFQAQIAEVAAE